MGGPEYSQAVNTYQQILQYNGNGIRPGSYLEDREAETDFRVCSDKINKRVQRQLWFHIIIRKRPCSELWGIGRRGGVTPMARLLVYFASDIHAFIFWYHHLISLLGDILLPLLVPFVPGYICYLDLASQHFHPLDRTSGSAMRLWSNLAEQVHPRNLFGTSGRKKPYFYWTAKLEGLNLEGTCVKMKPTQSKLGLRVWVPNERAWAPGSSWPAVHLLP